MNLAVPIREQLAFPQTGKLPVMYISAFGLRDVFIPQRRRPAQPDPRQQSLLVYSPRRPSRARRRAQQVSLDQLLATRRIAAQMPSGPPLPLMGRPQPPKPLELCTIDDLGPAVRPRDYGSLGPRPRSQSDAKLKTREKLFVGVADVIHRDYEADRPVVRGDCLPGGINEQRPCPWVSCQNHMYLTVNPRNGSLHYTWPGMELSDMPATCALDVADERADRPPLDFVALGRLLNMDDTGARKQVLRHEHRMKEALLRAGVRGKDG